MSFDKLKKSVKNIVSSTIDAGTAKVDETMSDMADAINSADRSITGKEVGDTGNEKVSTSKFDDLKAKRSGS